MSVALSYRLDGPEDAPVVVLGPSLGTTTELFAPQIEALSQRFRVVRYDLPGHGSSPDHAGELAMEQLADGVVALLDELGTTRAHVGGVSLGGMIALTLALRHPQRVDRLWGCCTSAAMPPASAWAERIATVGRDGTAASATLERWFTAGFRERAPATVAVHQAMLESVARAGYAACCAAIRDYDLRAELAQIAAPTVVVAGADDPATPPSHARLIADAVPGARLVVIDDAAHLANVEQADAVTTALLEALP